MIDITTTPPTTTDNAVANLATWFSIPKSAQRRLSRNNVYTHDAHFSWRCNWMFYDVDSIVKWSKSDRTKTEPYFLLLLLKSIIKKSALETATLAATAVEVHSNDAIWIENWEANWGAHAGWNKPNGKLIFRLKKCLFAFICGAIPLWCCSRHTKPSTKSNFRPFQMNDDDDDDDGNEDDECVSLVYWISLLHVCVFVHRTPSRLDGG